MTTINGAHAVTGSGRNRLTVGSTAADRMREQAAASEPGALARINAEFHIALATCSQNGVLTGYLRDLNQRVRFYYLAAAGSRRAESLAEHRRIADAVHRRDTEQARTLMRAHISDTRTDAICALVAEPAAAPSA